MAEHSDAPAGQTALLRTTNDTTETAATPADGSESPTAAFDYAPSVPVTGDAITIAAVTSSREADRRCEWTFDDGTTAGGETVTHTYDSGGRKEVLLTVTGDRGSDSVRRTVTVYREVALDLDEFERRDGDVLLPVDISGEDIDPSSVASLRLGSPAAVAMGGGGPPVRTEERDGDLRAWFRATDTDMTGRESKMRLAGRTDDGVPLVGTVDDRTED